MVFCNISFFMVIIVLTHKYGILLCFTTQVTKST